MRGRIAILICWMAGVGLLAQIGVVAAESFAAKPWIARGTVTDVQGQPVAGAEIIAHCGWGTLFPTGKAVSGADGSYELRFGPGVHTKNFEGVQAATISVHKPGYFETNLYRQGDLVAAYKKPEGELGWGKKGPEDLFLPGQARTINFVLATAGSVSGVVQDAKGKPLAGKRIGITGEVLPPSSSVIAEKKTDAQGRFEFKDVPTGYRFKLYVDDGRADWRKWPSAELTLERSGQKELRVRIHGDALELR